MEITVTVPVDDEEKAAIELQLRRVNGTESIDEFVSRMTRKLVLGWTTDMRMEAEKHNRTVVEAIVKTLNSDPRRAEKVKKLGYTFTEVGTLKAVEKPATLASAGLQVGFGQPIDLTVLADLKIFGYTIIRIDLQQCDQPTTTALAQEVLDAGLQPLCTIRRPEQMLACPEGALIELGNEPDLAQFGFPIDEYYKAAAECVEIAVANKRRLYLGAVSNLNFRGFNFLRQLPWDDYPQEICCSVHRYPDGSSPENPHRGWSSRDAETDTLRNIVGNRPLACSEIGYYDGPNGWTEEDVATHFVWERDFFTREGFDFVSAYQINDGTGPEAPDQHFGFRRLDGTWKPVASAFGKGSV